MINVRYRPIPAQAAINKVGENEVKGDIHLFDMSFNYAQARAYRKSQGGYLRANQWYDLEAEVWIAT